MAPPPAETRSEHKLAAPLGTRSFCGDRMSNANVTDILIKRSRPLSWFRNRRCPLAAAAVAPGSGTSRQPGSARCSHRCGSNLEVRSFVLVLGEHHRDRQIRSMGLSAWVPRFGRHSSHRLVPSRTWATWRALQPIRRTRRSVSHFLPGFTRGHRRGGRPGRRGCPDFSPFTSAFSVERRELSGVWALSPEGVGGPPLPHAGSIQWIRIPVHGLCRPPAWADALGHHRLPQYAAGWRP